MSDKPSSKLKQTGAPPHHVCVHSVSPAPFGQIQQRSLYAAGRSYQPLEARS